MKPALELLTSVATAVMTRGMLWMLQDRLSYKYFDGSIQV